MNAYSFYLHKTPSSYLKEPAGPSQSNAGGPDSPASTSSPSPELSTSRENHASSSGSAESFFSAATEVPSPSSTPSTPENQNPSIESSPPKDNFEFLSSREREFWEIEVLRAFHEGLDQVDPQGKIGKIPPQSILSTFQLDSCLLSKKEAETICSTLRKTPWPSYQEADRTSVYARVWNLLEKHKRPKV